ncbi:MAG: hypothetical protein ABEL76_14370, partial [Bradymonadaceae bacterium]
RPRRDRPGLGGGDKRRQLRIAAVVLGAVGFVWGGYGLATSGLLEVAKFLPLFGVGWVGLVYLAFNRTILEVSTATAGGPRLRVTHRPLPWKAPGTFDLSDVDQFFIEERATKGRYGRNYHYDLVLQRQNGESETCLQSIGSRQAADVERALEAALGLEDREVPGEYELGF